MDDEKQREPEYTEIRRSDMKMIETAIKRNWPIPEEIMKSLPLQMALIVKKSTTERNKIAAARVIIAMHGQNVQPEAGQTINVGVSVNATIDEQRNTTLAIARRIKEDRLLRDA